MLLLKKGGFVSDDDDDSYLKKLTSQKQISGKYSYSYDTRGCCLVTNVNMCQRAEDVVTFDTDSVQDYFVFVNGLEGTLLLRKPLDYEALSNFSVNIRAQVSTLTAVIFIHMFCIRTSY
jgi:hypothetical protein